MWWRVSIISFAFILIAAHFLRIGQLTPTIIFAIAPLLLILKNNLVIRLLQITLVISAIFIWGISGYDYIEIRLAMGRPWIRLFIIMGSITLFTLIAALCCNGIIKNRRDS